MNPRTNQIESGDIKSETRLVLRNLRSILEAGGSSLRDVVRIGVFMADINDFAGMNEVFREFFPDDPPARTTVGCVLPKIKVEIDCIAGCGSVDVRRSEPKQHSGLIFAVGSRFSFLRSSATGATGPGRQLSREL